MSFFLNTTQLEQQTCARGSVRQENHWLIPYSSDYAAFMMIMSAATSISSFIQASSLAFVQPIEERRLQAQKMPLLPWLLTGVSNLCWTIYGMMLADYALTVSSAVAALGTVVLIGLIAYYRSAETRLPMPGSGLRFSKTTQQQVSETKQMLNNLPMTAADMMDIKDVMMLRLNQIGYHHLSLAKIASIEASLMCTPRKMTVVMFITTGLAVYFAVSCTLIARCRT